MTKVIKGRSSYQLILSYISKTLLFPKFWETPKKSNTQNFKKSMIAYNYFEIDKAEMLSRMEPEALKSRA